MNSLVEPGFAKDPPVKLNVNAKILGLVLLILGALGILVDLIALIGIFGFCSLYSSPIYGSGCSLPVIWLLGTLVGLAATILGTTGAFRMYQENPQGKEWVVYGLILGFIGAVISLIGNLSAFNGLTGVAAGAGVIVGLVIDLIIYSIIYYLVVVSRFPSQAPMTPPTAGAWGGPSAPPPPPMR